MPNDRVAADLLKMVTAPVPEPAVERSGQQPTPQAPREAVQPAPKPIDPATLVGSWNANRDDGSKFNLEITNNSKFTWSFTSKGQASQQFGGTYSVDNNVLALERKDGGSLIGEVIAEGPAKFNFKLLGAPTEDPGLNFSR
jgi:uncharacterized protein (TIGR03066 family)